MVETSLKFFQYTNNYTSVILTKYVYPSDVDFKYAKKIIYSTEEKSGKVTNCNFILKLINI